MLSIKNDEFIVYTVLLGPSESINIQPQIKYSKLRHVCLTNNKNLKSNDWEFIYIDPILPHDNHRSHRNFKIRPHLIFSNYKYSLYLDNSVILKKKSEDFINKIISDLKICADENFFYLPFHSQKADLLSEFNETASRNLDNQIRFYDQLNHYIKTDPIYLQKKPYWGGILLRNHNHKDVINFSEIWFSHVCRYTLRDQLSLIYSAIQCNLEIKGFKLDNKLSEFHIWPVENDRRVNRQYNEKLIDHIPYNFIENLTKKIKENEDQLNRIEYEKKIINQIFPLNIIRYIFFKLKFFLKSQVIKRITLKLKKK